MRMHNPPHPGASIKELYLDPLDIKISDAAKAMNMPRAALSEIINGRRGISPKVAIKLEKAFSRSSRSWLKAQMNYDIWNEEQEYNAEDVCVLYKSEKAVAGKVA